MLRTPRAALRRSSLPYSLLTTGAPGVDRLRRRPRLDVEVLEGRHLPAGTITGLAFQDFNANGVFDTTATVANASGVGSVGGAVDRGLNGVTVTAYDAANVVRGTATTATNGTYSLAASGTGPYRIEFTGLPTGFGAGPRGTSSGSTVQFVPDGNSANINAGLVRATDTTSGDPTLFATQFNFGAYNGANASSVAVLSFNYSDGSDYTNTTNTNFSIAGTRALAVPASQVGSVWSLAYDSVSNTVFAAAYMKRHVGFGPNGTGAIYRMNTTGTTASLFVDLNALLGAGTTGSDPHNASNYDSDNYDTTRAAVGKVSFGGMAVSDDGRFLYVMNLANRRLYEIPLTVTPTAGNIRSVAVPLATVPNATGTNGDDIRPFAVTFYQGQLYVGMVNSAQSTGLATDLRAYVYRVDPTTLTFGTTPLVNQRLDYPRGSSYGGSDNWRAWRDTFSTVGTGTQNKNPQPMLSGIAFDAVGNMVLGLRDRGGDQSGRYTLEVSGSTQTYEGLSSGDTLRVAINTPNDLTSGWTVEANGSAGGVTTSGAGDGQGPTNGSGTGGEFYYQDNYSTTHNEITTGGVTQVPGFPDVVTTVYDPAYSVRSGGVRWLNNATGRTTKAYTIYETDAPGTFGKAAGMGGLTVVRGRGPIEIGDRVWDDVNSNGIQDAGEAGLANVTVELRDATGATVIATATTDANGNFIFSSAAGSSTTSRRYGLSLQPSTAYRLQVPNGQAAVGTRVRTQATADASPNGASRDSNGVATTGATLAAITTAGFGIDDHTFDFGFTQPADLSLTKAVDNATPNIGQTVTFTLTLTNSGPGDATGVTVTDVLPAGLAFVSASTATGSYSSTTGIWTIGALANGATATLTLRATVTTPGAKTNIAEVTTSDQPDPDSTPGNNSTTEDDDDTATVTPQVADLSLTKTVDNATPILGSNVTFTITVRNAGPNGATNVAVRDVLPSGLTFVSATPSQGSYASGTGIWTVGSVANGGTATMQIVATVTTLGVKVNGAEVSAADQFDPDSTPNNNSTTEDDDDTATVTPGQIADLSLTKTVDNARPNIGQTVTFTITVSNAGPNGATNVAVRDLLPVGLTFVSSSPSQGSYLSGTGIWTVGSIASGGSATLQIVARVTTAGAKVNGAEVSASDQPDPDSTPGNNSTTEDDDDTATVTPQVADLSLTKTVDNATPLLGANVTFTITVRNAGPDGATNVAVRDVLPAGLQFVSSNPSQGSYASGTGIWTVGSIANGGTATMQIVATVTTLGVKVNGAEVSAADQFDPDSTPNNNSTTEDDDDTATVTPGQIADLSLTKTVDNARPNVGQTVTFTITVSNAGPNGATNVAVRDVLPSGLQFVSSSPSQGSYVSGTGIWTVGSIASGGSATLQIVARVTTAGAKVNGAEVSASDQPDPDSTPGNNSTTEDDDDTATVTPQVADLSLVKTVSNVTPNVGQTVTFTLTLANAGPDAATNVAVADLLPAGLQFVSSNPSQGSYNSATGLWTIGTVASGGSATLQVVARVTTVGAKTNVAQVSQSDQFDPDSTPNNNVPTEDDQSNATVTPPIADLRLAKSVDNAARMSAAS
ncbi:MAG: SdrD B-like domain-containing protein [Gemmataceae bacterium]